MIDLSTTYLGLKLKSPVIAGSSGLTSSLSKIKEAEENGAGAVVLKSIFEEQIQYAISSTPFPDGYPEAYDYISGYTKSNALGDYLDLITTAKRDLSIPVIPSINCFSAASWIEYAKTIASAGADALEVNVFFLPTDPAVSAKEAENLYFVLIEKLRKSISIPVSVKVGPRFSNILYMIDQFYKRGAGGVVMFNRFFEPDIDPEKISIESCPVFSSSDERRYVLRWIAMASAMNIKIDISASTGVHSGDDVLRYLLAGAGTVQVCSALYHQGMQYLKVLNNHVSDWMERKGFRNIGEFRGKLNYSAIDKPRVYERTQFMKYFSSLD